MKQKYTKKQIQEAIKYWTGILETIDKNKWYVTFSADDMDNYYTISFDSKADADNWIKCKQNQSRYDRDGFEVIEGPIQK